MFVEHLSGFVSIFGVGDAFPDWTTRNIQFAALLLLFLQAASVEESRGSKWSGGSPCSIYLCSGKMCRHRKVRNPEASNVHTFLIDADVGQRNHAYGVPFRSQGHGSAPGEPDHDRAEGRGHDPPRQPAKRSHRIRNNARLSESGSSCLVHECISGEYLEISETRWVHRFSMPVLLTEEKLFRCPEESQRHTYM